MVKSSVREDSGTGYKDPCVQGLLKKNIRVRIGRMSIHMSKPQYLKINLEVKVKNIKRQMRHQNKWANKGKMRQGKRLNNTQAIQKTGLRTY